jgi:hypothetical protein
MTLLDILHRSDIRGGVYISANTGEYVSRRSEIVYNDVLIAHECRYFKEENVFI